MIEDELAELLRDCPTLYHMTHRGNWHSIRQHGLLSTSALLDLWAGDERRRGAIEAARRPTNVIIEHHDLGRAVVCDQKPMDDASLLRCLQDGLTPTDWYRLLNARIFFWLTRARLHRLLNARPYRALEHEVLELDAAALVSAHRTRIRLCPINSGSTKPFPRARGRDTFLPIGDYPYADWRARRSTGERVVELSVLGGVPDAERFVRRVTIMRGEQLIGVLLERQ